MKAIYGSAVNFLLGKSCLTAEYIYVSTVSAKLFFCNRRDTTRYHVGLWSRELCQALMLLMFLTPRQALSSHPRVIIMILWESRNFHPDKQLFQVASARDRTTDPWVTSPTLPRYTTGDSLFDIYVSKWVLSFYWVSTYGYFLTFSCLKTSTA